MNKFVEKLRLKEMADEDMYFAKQDRALLEALHNKELTKIPESSDTKCKTKAKVFEKRFDRITDKHKKKPHKLFRSLNALLQDIKKTCKRLR